MRCLIQRGELRRRDDRIAGHSPWWDMHTAFTVREEDFYPDYRRMWESLPEEAGSKEHWTPPAKKKTTFPRPAGKIYQRGDEFYDRDSTAFHFIDAIKKSRSVECLALCTPKEQNEHLSEPAESLKKGAQP